MKCKQEDVNSGKSNNNVGSKELLDEHSQEINNTPANEKLKSSSEEKISS